MDIDTNPQGSVDDGPAPSIEDRMLSLMGTGDGQPERRDEEAPAEEIQEDQPEVEAQEASEELPEDADQSEEEESPDPEVEASDDTEQPESIEEDAEAKAEEERLAGLREADYRRKTQEVAEQRKAVEADKAAIAQERQRYAQSLEYLQSQIPQPTPPNADLLEQAPIEYLRQKEAFDANMQRHQAMQAERQRVAQQQQAEMLQAREALVKEQQAKVAELIPDWADDAKRESLVKDVQAYMSDEGFSGEEIGGLVQAHHLNTVRKAMLYDKLMAQKPKVEKKVRDAPKVVKPGAATTRDSKAEAEERARKRLRKSGSVDDAAAAILSRMQ